MRARGLVVTALTALAVALAPVAVARGVTGRANGAAPAERVRPLVELPDAPEPIEDWMKRHGWASKRHSPRRFELGQGRLHLVSGDDSVLIGTREGFPIDPRRWPRLRFRLRVDEVPTGADLSRKRGDDAAFRVYVAFDRGGTWISPPDTIAYTWTAGLAPETVVRSPHYKRLRYLSVGRGVTTDLDGDGWVTVERDLLADYARVFGRDDVPELVGFMLKCDTNNTGTRASAWLEALELVAPADAEG